MTRKEALAALMAKVEAGEEPRETIAGAAFDVQPTLTPLRGAIADAYNGSLDAAKALHEAVLTGWEWEIGFNGSGWAIVAKDDATPDIHGTADTTARAWLLAILKALHAQEPK